MFKIQPAARFEASLTIVGQGREQKLECTFVAKTRTEYADRLKAIAEGKASPADVVLELLEKWNADGPLDKDTLQLLEDHQPGACWAILTGYGEALMVARKGN